MLMYFQGYIWVQKHNFLIFFVLLTIQSWYWFLNSPTVTYFLILWKRIPKTTTGSGFSGQIIINGAISSYCNHVFKIILVIQLVTDHNPADSRTPNKSTKSEGGWTDVVVGWCWSARMSLHYLVLQIEQELLQRSGIYLSRMKEMTLSNKLHGTTFLYIIFYYILSMTRGNNK